MRWTIRKPSDSDAMSSNWIEDCKIGKTVMELHLHSGTTWEKYHYRVERLPTTSGETSGH